MLTLYAILGGFLNRVRGGLVHSFSDMIPSWLFKSINSVDKLIQGFIFGSIKGFTISPLVGLISALAMWGGAQIGGWGSYIGAMYKKDASRTEFAPIDFIIKPLSSNAVLWGLAGLSLRGAIWGGLLGLVCLSIWPLLAGFCMGMIYYITEKVIGIKHAWEVSEAIFGSVLWIACFI